MNNMTFGECLKCMLSALEVSMNRLAKYINVDNSLVNRWVHEKRIPPYGSAHIENIAEYLSKNVHNTFQISYINDIITKQGLWAENLSNTEDKIKKILFEAQGYSLECRKKLLIKKKEMMSEIKHRDLIETKTIAYMKQFKGIEGIIELSSNDKVIFGSDNIIKFLLELLNEASLIGRQDNKTIYITYNNSIITANDEIVKTKKYFVRIIKKGWKIIFLLKLDNNVKRILSFIEFAMPLIKTGECIIYYYNNYGLSDEQRETFVIPEVGAMSIFVNNFNSEIKTAFYLKSITAINVFKEYFEVQLKNNAHPLIRHYSENEYKEFCRILSESEDSIGNRMVYTSNLSTMMLPEHIYLKLLNNCMLSDDIIKFAFKNYKKQCNAFKRNIKHYEYNEIYLMDSINSLIKSRKFYLYYYSGIKQVKLEIEDVIKLLERIIYNLKTYKNYNVLFINKKDEKLIMKEDFSFVLKERKTFFYECCYKLKNNYPAVRISVDEPFILKAFEEYFRKTWDHISPVYREKADVIRFLQRQIDALR